MRVIRRCGDDVRTNGRDIFFCYQAKMYICIHRVRRRCEKKSNQIHLFQFWRWRLRFPSVRPHKSVVKSFSRTSFAAMNGRQLNTHSRRRRHHISQWDITLECQNGEWYAIYTYTIYYLNIYILCFYCVCVSTSLSYFSSLA